MCLLKGIFLHQERLLSFNTGLSSPSLLLKSLLIRREILSQRKVLRFAIVSIDVGVAAWIQGHVAAALGVQEELVLQVLRVDDLASHFELLRLEWRLLQF